MKMLQKICFVLLLTTPLSVYGGSCFKNIPDVDDCLKRAEQGNAFAQAMIGSLYESGQVVPQDHKEAVKWYRKAAGQNFEPAKAALKKLSEQQKPKK